MMRYEMPGSLLSLGEGFPFQRGQWVAPTPGVPVAPYLTASQGCEQSPATVDSIQLSSQALAAQADEGCVQVQAGDSLSELLLKRGYSLKEMYETDENGQTLLDRTAANNGLKDANRIQVGQELFLPTKECLDNSESMNIEKCDSGQPFDETYAEDFDYADEFDYDEEFDYANESDYSDGEAGRFEDADDSSLDCACGLEEETDQSAPSLWTAVADAFAEVFG
jgi:hypothetical protein